MKTGRHKRKNQTSYVANRADKRAAKRERRARRRHFAKALDQFCSAVGVPTPVAGSQIVINRKEADEEK